MKKIFISAVSAVLIGSIGICGVTSSANASFWQKDSDGYWLNRLRGYKSYPIHFYSADELNNDVSALAVDAHEYERDVAVSAKVGQAMFDREAYVSNNQRSESYHFSEKATIRSPIYDYKFKKTDIMKPIGEIKMNGEYYMLLPMPNSSYIILADTDGNLQHMLGYLDDGNLLISHENVYFYPQDLRIIPYIADNDEENQRLATKYSIIYNGIGDGEMLFSYTSETDTDSEDFAFPLMQRFIEINDIPFEIINAQPDYIEYKILDTENSAEGN